jgi:glycine cleavage system aminomethyltransferase T
MANIFVPMEACSVEGGPLLYHGDILWRNGEEVSYVRAASYGFTVGGGVGLTMLDSFDGSPITKGWINDASWQLQIAEKFYPCTISLAPLYDPKNLKIKPS